MDRKAVSPTKKEKKKKINKEEEEEEEEELVTMDNGLLWAEFCFNKISDF